MRRAFFAGAILLAGTLVSASAYADRVVTHHFEAATRAPAVRRVIVEIPAGEVRIVNSTANMIRVSGVSKREYDPGQPQRAAADRRRRRRRASTRIATRRSSAATSVRTRAAGASRSSRRRGHHRSAARRQRSSSRRSTARSTSKARSANVDVDLRAGEISAYARRASNVRVSTLLPRRRSHRDLGDTRSIKRRASSPARRAGRTRAADA